LGLEKDYTYKLTALFPNSSALIRQFCDEDPPNLKNEKSVQYAIKIFRVIIPSEGSECAWAHYEEARTSREGRGGDGRGTRECNGKAKKEIEDSLERERKPRKQASGCPCAVARWNVWSGHSSFKGSVLKPARFNPLIFILVWVVPLFGIYEIITS